MLKTQDEISVGLVRALQLSMGTDEPGSRPTLKNVDAYTLYLRGRQAFDRLDKAGFDQAASYFRQTMQLDSESALAPAWLAFVYFEQATYGFVGERLSVEFRSVVDQDGFGDAEHFPDGFSRGSRCGPDLR